VLGDERGYYVCEVTERLPAGVRPRADVGEEIRAALVLDRKKEQAMHKADAFYRKLRSGPVEVSEAAALYGYQSARIDTFVVGDSVDGQPPRSPLAYAAFDMNPGDVSPPVESYGSYYVLKVLDRSAIDEAAFVVQAEAIRQRVYQSKAQEYIGYWYQNLRENSKIEDYRGAAM
jgi:hypothetical protein